nr:cyclin-dependent kinase F-4-like isoform X1 [Tanacetum cinerariifolium]
MAELFTLLPLFPGSSEADEIYKICSVIGSPTEFTWREGLERASKIRYQFPEVAGVNISALIPSASKEAVNLIGALCSWDPSKRPTAVEALQHPFFQSCYYIPPSLRSKAAAARMSPSVGLNGRGAIEHNYTTGYSVFLPNVKPANNVISSAKVPTFGSIGVHHKMEANHQSGVTNEKLYQAREPKYQPIGKYRGSTGGANVEAAFEVGALPCTGAVEWLSSSNTSDSFTNR